MDWSVLLKTGVLVDVTTKGGNTITGFLDQVGITQAQGKILLADQRPQIGLRFSCIEIAIENITNLQLSSSTKANF